MAIGTDVENDALHYGIVVDCGSSGSRVYVYFWPPHDGNPQELLSVQPMREEDGDFVVKKIEPGKWEEGGKKLQMTAHRFSGGL